jgi:hypothetical protein
MKPLIGAILLNIILLSPAYGTELIVENSSVETKPILPMKKKVHVKGGKPSANNPPDEIKPFIESGAELRFLVYEDLDGDNRKDYILVLERQGKEYSDADNQRPFLIVLRQLDGSLNLVKRNDRIIMCSTCGGGWGDPFEDVFVDKRSFSITQRGGGGTRWFVLYKFNYSNRDKTWQLVQVEDSSFNISDINNGETHIYKPPKDYGKIDISEFDPNNYLGVGPK